MTAIDLSAAPAARAARRAPGPVALALVAALPIALALGWGRTVAVWDTGTFFDTDDAMRAVQLRDWMAGQGWFDLAAHRMDPPAGVVMHWSRVVDVPLAALVRLFSLGLPPDLAERAARIAFPVALQAAMIAAMAHAARVLAGAGAAVPAGLLIALGGISVGQFAPGRIDHHAPQIVLLTLMTASTLASLDPARARQAALTGLAVALSLAISLENLPFMAVLLAAPPLAWAAVGAPSRPALLWLAGGLGLAIPALFFATVPPSRYGLADVDALSLFHLGAVLLGCVGLLALAAVTRRCGGAGRRDALVRAAAVAVVGVAACGTLALLFPGCLRGPYATLDPLLQRLWLDGVTEAKPLLALGQTPDRLAVMVGPLLVGAACALAALRASRGLARARWTVVAALVGVGFAGAVWQVRVASSLQPVALLGAAWGVARAVAAARRSGRASAMAVPAALLCAGSGLAWAAAPLPGTAEGPAVADGLVDGRSCGEAAAYAPLAALPPGLAFAPIDSGSHLLAHTKLSVVAAPYHRDVRGDLAVLRGLVARPDEARATVRATGARYLLFCPSRGQARVLVGAAPDGLAAALAAGRAPGWLRPLPLDGPTPYRAYAVE